MTTVETEMNSRLQNGKVLIVGVGGLGSPAALALAIAGVGMIGLVDPDTVELSNLQRQILHATSDLGKPKVVSAREKLLRINPRVTVQTHYERLHPGNLRQLFLPYDFIIDGTDSVVTKFLINDGAVFMRKPFSYGGVVQFHGQTLTVLPGQSACLRCLFPVPPDPDEIPTCQESGILGSLAGSLGCMQANEAVKYLKGQNDLLTNCLLTYEAQALRWRTVAVQRNLHCPLCSPVPTITGLHLEKPQQAENCAVRERSLAVE
jgi:molybdopterin/thiamine biosynthesis adenylyltransferase